MLSGIDFNRTGGGLLFNHPGGIASDGTRLLLADRNNNRILVWSKPPGPAQEPDIVLGQVDFESNNPGTGRSQLNWPSAASVGAKGRLAVADTYNDRILLWNTFPASSGTPADIEIRLPTLTTPGTPQPFGWPWGVWTDGARLVATATGGSAILFWNQFPVSDNQRPDFALTDPAFGTPRAITSDGNYLIVDDHNANLPAPPPGPLVQQHTGTFFWRRFPKSPADRFDFGISGSRLRGGTVDGKLVLLGWTTMQIWDHFPVDENDKAQVTASGPWSSDGEGIAVAGGTIYTFDGNWNSILAYRRVPDRSDAQPDFVIGAPDAGTNTLQTRFFITTPIPVSNGQSLFVSSGFDRKLHVWKQLPDESGALPDVVYSLPTEPAASAVHGGALVLAGRQTVYIWNHPPLNGELPDRILSGAIGGAQVGEWYGAALDDNYFYLSDTQLGKVYVWRGIPGQNSDPIAVINVSSPPTRISSDGRYLAVPLSGPPASVCLYDVARLPSNTEPVAIVTRPGLNLPGGALLADGKLFVLDTVFSRTLVWSSVESAIAGRDPDIILGATSLDERTPEIGQNKQFWPAGASFDGSYLWVGEYKFSGRLLRYSPVPSTSASQKSFLISDLAGASLTSSGDGHVVSGYAAVRPDFGGVAPAGSAIFALRQNGILVSEVSVAATSTMTSGRIHAEISGAVNAGLAIVNPNSIAAMISFYFTDASGNPAGAGFTTVSAGQQIAQFLDQPPFKVYSTPSFQGSFTFTSSVPVAVIALRGFSNERGEFIMSVLPVVDTASPPSRGTVVVPHFADGGGWSTQVLLINPTDTAMTGSVEFADQLGRAASVSIGDQTGSTFAYSVPKRASQKLQTTGAASATISGSVRIVPADGGPVPKPLIMFSYKPATITVSEAGVPVTAGTAFRMFVESSGTSGKSGGVRSAVAIANSSSMSTSVMFELTGLDGARIAAVSPVSIPLAAGRQTAKFLDEVFPSLPNPFSGILRITSSTAELSAVGLRTRVNERNDFLITTTSPAVETTAARTDPLYFPQVASGGGYTTQFMLFSATPGRVARGILDLSRQDGSPFFLTLSTNSGAPPSIPFNELVARLMSGQLSESAKEALRGLVADMKSGRIQGPWFDEVRLATSNDGLNFTDTQRTVLRKAFEIDPVGRAGRPQAADAYQPGFHRRSIRYGAQ
jgi:hypothetical protein